MSVDYWSVCLATSPAAAREAYQSLAPLQQCGAIVGPGEEDLLPGWTGARKVDVAKLARSFGGRLPPEEMWEGAAVQMPEEALDLISEADAGLVMTNRSSAIAGLDRVLALPRGVKLLGGHAVAHVPAAGVPDLQARVSGLWKQLGGKAKAAQTLERFLFGNCNEGSAEELVENLEQALERAKKGKLDLVLLSAIPP